MSGSPVIFDSRVLLPDAWGKSAGAGPIYAFNPTLVDAGEGWLMAYRLVLADGLRRIALCRLGGDLEPQAGSARPFSDCVRFQNPTTLAPQALTWFADPRLYRLAGRLWLHWNSGWHEPSNHQFIVELDPSSLAPVGSARELILAGERQPIEKNWVLWGDGPFRATYSPSPHRVLSLSLDGEGDIVCEPLADHPWHDRLYERRFGRLRGGTPPQRHGDLYFALCHSMTGTPVPGCDYHPAAYAFSAEPPYEPRLVPHRSLPLPAPPPRSLPTLNRAVARVVYPNGLVRKGDHWLVSYGMNDERCAIAPLSDAQLLGSLIPLNLKTV
ncbi:hypothetical protein GALL_115780 [mine drainage metagenome]|uniref:Glycosidase n=1 Tax=mine drainage metagenome TaxID=410659 RepID=A0A1J5SXR2_9ZZZZ